jgi:hypothetical protein
MSVLVSYESKSIWEYEDYGFWMVIPVVTGWDVNGRCVMKAGHAAHAVRKYPHIPEIVGMIMKQNREKTKVFPLKREKLIIFPEVPLNPVKPWLSWRDKPTKEQVARSMIQLCQLMDEPSTSSEYQRVAMPLVGAGGVPVRLCARIINASCTKYLTRHQSVIVADIRI